jgi:hypothetical protein
MKERIGLQDTGMDMMLKMSDGNPGAVTVLCQMLEQGGKIDPDCFAGGFGAILSLDSYGIYGSRIWMLYKDVCGENITTTLAVLRACQLGFVTESKINHAIDNYGEGIDVSALVAAVKERDRKSVV